MLETLDLNLSLDKESYKQELMPLMRNLRSLQQACWQKKLPVVIVLEGWAAAGKGALLQKMVGYMDPRGFEVHPVWPPTADERRYPFLWRFWQKLPERGKFSIFYHSWYTHVLEDRLFGRIPESQMATAFQEINAFERQLVDDGAAIAKFWIHLSKKELKKRLKKYAKDPLDAWRVRPEDWQQSKNYSQYAEFAEEMLQQTSTGVAPWTLIEGDNKRWARVKVLTQMAASLTEALDRLHGQQPAPQATPQTQLSPTEPDFLSAVDLSLSLSHDEYKAKLREQQIRLRKLQQEIYQNKVPVLILFEGWDAAGKGGAIKRLTDVLDPRSYKVRAFGPPTEDEKQHHYLWRFWRRLPPAGQLAIFDRSWYGRVLVERVEGFATEAQWRRAYREINEFESQLVSAGYVLVKFWLHISPEEQLKRFYERKENPFKSYKLTTEDWRNREKWSLYEVAVNQTIQRTSTPIAPWTIVPGNDKYYARVRTIEAVSTAMENQLKQI
ncbi:polyphosphate:AMP phosphotransferase [Geitlerinema sp. PCC 9228]|jgi:polyphosphate:AMP phosphotransferase|uniref:polyphosphate:AMP phosphotransferase n=1 Tax=Geitlerinema sp. PCC 9228 TaxID=111611 RepID=UPI0008F99FCE|nr:polyphosphate:AMP phosphotransferase [Geitlerinema sp. PCC 9228]